MVFDVEIYPPLKDKISAPVVELEKQVVDTGGQGRLTLRKGNKKRLVSTCQQYEKALSSGYLANTTFDSSIASFFVLWCGSLNYLTKATTASKSYVSNFNLETEYKNIPPDILFSPLGQKPVPSNEIMNDIVILKSHARMMLLESKQTKHRAVINVLAKADFNNDGIQDILISIAEYAVQGSYRHYGVYALSKKSQAAKLMEIAE